MKLFTPAWKSNDEKKAQAWIAGCGSQKKLTVIAKEAPGIERRVAAIKKITDQEILMQAAIGGSRFYNDETLSSSDRRLYNLQHRYPDEACQEAAIECISDPEVLYRIAEEGPYHDARYSDHVTGTVVMKLRDAGYDMEAMAANPELPYETRCAAIGYVGSQDFLIRLADEEARAKGKRITVLRKAIQAISDPAARKRFCATEKTHEWESVSYEVKEIGDTRFITSVERCRYCGQEKEELESYKF